MKILLKEGADVATSESILIPSQRGEATLETLAGESRAKGILAEADGRVVTSALNEGARSRQDELVTAKDLQKAAKWLHKALGEYEVGSKIGLKPTRRGVLLDDSEATRIDRAQGLAEGDGIAVGPKARPLTLLNMRGRVVAIEGDQARVELDPGDRDRYQRATGKEIAEQIPIPVVCVEKLS